MIVVVHDGIDDCPEAHPVPHYLQDISPDGPIVPGRFSPGGLSRSIGQPRHIHRQH